jgi:hypothetical protein
VKRVVAAGLEQDAAAPMPMPISPPKVALDVVGVAAADVRSDRSARSARAK